MGMVRANVSSSTNGTELGVAEQGGHVLLFRCTSDDAQPLRHLAQRVHTTRVRRKIAVVAAARFILRTAFYVLRDGTSHEPHRLRGVAKEESMVA